MNAPVDPSLHAIEVLMSDVALACDRIAPTWPLDRFIAVNPWWGWVGRPIDAAAAELGVLARTRLTMPREWFLARWRDGALRREHVEAAIALTVAPMSADSVAAAMSAPTPAPVVPPLVADLRDAHAEPGRAMRWTDLVVHQIAQHCAAVFDDGQARWRIDGGDGLFASWRRQVEADRGLPWRSGRRTALASLRAVPADPHLAIGAALEALGVDADARAPYLSALLSSVGGWAAWCAYQRWQARLDGRDDDTIVELLAIRATWERLLRDDAAPGTIDAGWARAWSRADAAAAALRDAQRVDWVLQHAVELAWRMPLATAFAAPLRAPAVETAFQAVFCIDVRSEVFRRALEATGEDLRTIGFAGFFGLPIAYSPAGTALTRPQLPGLLAPGPVATESAPEDGGRPLASALLGKRRDALAATKRWAELRGTAASGFSFVEACGLLYGAKLLADGSTSTEPPPAVEHAGLPAGTSPRPRLAIVDIDPKAAAAMARGILGAMGLARDFAPLVLLAGHGSRTVNNPHAAGLDCGACGGQTGEVNARVLADLLNAPVVRAELAALGVAIPASTHFVPGLHDTTTDDVRLFDLDALPVTHVQALAALRERLAAAGRTARAERAASLGLAPIAGDADALADAIRRRGTDWAQVRPEWGLADCAGFIVAPRARTRGLDLGGRAFLHDYDFREDTGGAVLELIMTAPMVVTNWINLQYHASTVDNRRYGSGDKTLHNVVGGGIGVFEGNGGDLRIGLALQSVHDGEQWRHTPRRLAVHIEAPRAMIDAVIAKHAVVRDLVVNGWLHLLRIDPNGGAVEQRLADGWRLAPAG
jgi:uncharacterized protein YbcC (UPF0753/DUF2309 family)